METACLRIKFTPLFKEPEKHNSQCCLEIVPEVSHIQNFDKLIWKKESNCIEYTVPMTYKIILRKRNKPVDKGDDIIKTYYSCVDLLWSTSQSNYDLASGDISRIISDTFMLSKIPANNIINRVNDVTQSGTATHETVTTFDLKDLSIRETEDEVANDGVRKSKSKQYYINNVGTMLCDKNTNTDNIDAVQTFDVNPDIPKKNKSRPESKNILSVPPMISVKTHRPSPTLPRNTMSQSITCNVCNVTRELVLSPANSQVDVSKEILLSGTVSNLGDISKNIIKSPRSRSTYKYSPEMRIAQCVQYMKTELLPLNKFLDQLISKCSALGVNNQLSRTKPPSNHLLLYKSISESKDNITVSYEKSLSNRAVFSIISDD